MKDETSGVAVEEFLELKPKMYSFLVDDSNENNKEKGMGKNFVANISHSEFKDVLLNNKCLLHSINSKNPKQWI